MYPYFVRPRITGAMGASLWWQLEETLQAACYVPIPIEGQFTLQSASLLVAVPAPDVPSCFHKLFRCLALEYLHAMRLTERIFMLNIRHLFP